MSSSSLVLSKRTKIVLNKRRSLTFEPTSYSICLDEDDETGESNQRTTMSEGHLISDETSFCPLCLESLPTVLCTTLSSCGCRYCTSCLKAYLEYNIANDINVPVLGCPDANCSKIIKSNFDAHPVSKVKEKNGIKSVVKKSLSLFFRNEKESGEESNEGYILRRQQQQQNLQNRLTRQEVESLIDVKSLWLYNKLMKEFEVSQDPNKVFCPSPNCDNICIVTQSSVVHVSCSNALSTSSWTGNSNNNKKMKLTRSMSSTSSILSVSPAAATAVLLTAKKTRNVLSTSASRTSFTNVINNIKHSSSMGSKRKSSLDSMAIPIYCSECQTTFCFKCRKPYHEGISCSVNAKNRLSNNNLLGVKESVEELKLSASIDTLSEHQSIGNKKKKNREIKGSDKDINIKRCPKCSVYIERDDGCAQMMCRKCRHVFCWFCLESLDDDFFLRHYDSGPCKNKLGHSRASVLWHRTQVIGIFAGFGLLILLASPLFLVAAPCLLCCSSSCCSCFESCFSKWMPKDEEQERRKTGKGKNVTDKQTVLSPEEQIHDQDDEENQLI